MMYQGGNFLSNVTQPRYLETLETLAGNYDMVIHPTPTNYGTPLGPWLPSYDID